MNQFIANIKNESFLLAQVDVKATSRTRLQVQYTQTKID